MLSRVPRKSQGKKHPGADRSERKKRLKFFVIENSRLYILRFNYKGKSKKNGKLSYNCKDGYMFVLINIYQTLVHHITLKMVI